MQENPKKTKGSNLGVMHVNLKQNEGIESGRDAGVPKTKGRDQIWARCQRTWNKRKGSNMGTMQENPNKNKRIEFVRDDRELEINLRDRIWA